MAGKIKVGIIGDAGAPTGFATVTHNIARYLQNSGEFDVQIIGINFDGRPNVYSKEFNIWPARLGGDLLGIGVIPDFFEQVKPDVFLMFQDFWNVPLYIAQCPPNTTGLVTYYPVDSPNIKGQFALSWAALAQNLCYTNFGVQESMRAAKEAWTNVKLEASKQNKNYIERFHINISLPSDPFGRLPPIAKNVAISAYQLRQLSRPEAYKVIPHGIDTSAFYKMPSKLAARKMLGLPVKGFFVGNVNRNQSRKRNDLSIRGFSEFYKKYPDSKLLLHCCANDGQGWDLNQLADYYGVRDAVIFTHDLFTDKVATVEQLNMLYNTFDVQINTGGGEGWGLNTFEGAAAGIPQIVPDWSATKEIWKDAGVMLKVASVRHEPSMINTMQAVIDTNHLVELLSEFHDNPNLKDTVGHKCFEVTQKPEYKWENVGKQFADTFKDCVGKSAPVAPVAFNPAGVVELKQLAQGRAVRIEQEEEVNV